MTGGKVVNFAVGEAVNAGVTKVGGGGGGGCVGGGECTIPPTLTGKEG